jgi:hypothetical protein
MSSPSSAAMGADDGVAADKSKADCDDSYICSNRDVWDSGGVDGHVVVNVATRTPAREVNNADPRAFGVAQQVISPASASELFASIETTPDADLPALNLAEQVAISMLARASASIENGKSSPRGEDLRGVDESDELRIEKWSRKNANGQRDYFWQWAKRKAQTGKRGGKRWREYGGILDAAGNFRETTGQRGGSRHRGNRGYVTEPS